MWLVRRRHELESGGSASVLLWQYNYKAPAPTAACAASLSPCWGPCSPKGAIEKAIIITSVETHILLYALLVMFFLLQRKQGISKSNFSEVKCFKVFLLLPASPLVVWCVLFEVAGQSVTLSWMSLIRLQMLPQTAVGFSHRLTEFIWGLFGSR